MGVYVKGMKMPKECRECYLLEYYEYLGETQCSITRMMLAERGKPISFDSRPGWCPLVEVPEPCTDTISSQAAIDAINNIMPTKEGLYEPSEVLYELMQLPYVQPEPCEDVVSRKTAIEAVMDLCKHYTPTKSVNHPHVDFVIEALQNLPSAHPEIIRCKDCKWWSNDDYRECSSPNYDDGYVTPAGFYCGYAERRTDD